MKKILIVFLSAGLLSVFASCSSVESKADEFAKESFEAASDFDFKKCSEISKEAMKYRESLSEEDQQKFDDEFAKATAEYTKDLSKGLDGALDAAKSFGADLDSISE